MLKKLLKYDLKWCYKALTIFYILSIISAILTRVFINIDGRILFTIIGKIMQGITITLLINILINNILRIWARVIKNFYSDEAYLTHTLPIKKETLFLSKVLTTIITVLTSTIVIVISLLICYYSKENIEILKNILNQINISNITIISTILIFYLEILFIILSGITAIILGYKQNNNKLLKSVLFGLIIYFTMQTLILAIIFIIGLFNKEIMDLFKTNNITPNLLKQILSLSTIIYIIYNIILYIIGNNTFKKGVNID